MANERHLTRYEGAGEIYFNGRLLVEATRARWSARPNDNPQRTMRKGFSGFSDGPTEGEISFETAIPVSGYEADFHDAVLNKREVVAVYKDANKRIQVAGRITSFDSERSVDNAASASIVVMGKIIGRL